MILVLDATVGQNALGQVEAFRNTAGVTGLVMTKLDGTAKGGVLAAIAEQHALPIHFVGVGEKAEDLHPSAPRPLHAHWWGWTTRWIPHLFAFALGLGSAGDAGGSQHLRQSGKRTFLAGAR